MGNSIFSAEPLPVSEGSPTFDPHLGFPNGRKERKCIATEQEMMASKVPLKNRDYCAHTYIALAACIRKHCPHYEKCAHEKHVYGECEYQDYILRMKEYERERRLLARQKKVGAIAA